MVLGLLLAVSCGVCWGIFLAPLRFLRGWEWENIWAVWAVVAALGGPIAIAIWTVPHFLAVNQQVGMPVILFTPVASAVRGSGRVVVFTS